MSRRRAVTAATSDASGRAELGWAREASQPTKEESGLSIGKGGGEAHG